MTSIFENLKSTQIVLYKLYLHDKNRKVAEGSSQ